MQSDEKKKKKRFTLLELLLVVVAICLMLAVIIPRSQRAKVDSKYNLVRQAAAELGAFANEWAGKQVEAQPEEASATLDDYLVSLSRSAIGPGPENSLPFKSGEYSFIPHPGNNWVVAAQGIKGRAGAAPENVSLPEAAVQDLVPREKMPRNPFNGSSYFRSPNDGSDTVAPGAIALLAADDIATGTNQNWHYFALIFQGLDNKAANDFYAGMGRSNIAGQDKSAPLGVANARNGVFVARTR